MLIAFAKENNGYWCKDTENGKAVKVLNNEVISGARKVDNLCIVNGNVRGNKFNADRFSNMHSEIGRSYVYKKRIATNGQDILGYFAITNKGKEVYIDINNIAVGFRYGVVNGDISDNKLTLRNNESMKLDRQYKERAYRPDEYLDMYKIYSDSGLVGQTVKVDFEHYDYNISHVRNYGKTISSNFIESHKIVYGLLVRSKITRFVKICDTYKVKDNTLEALNDKEFMYKLTFSCRGSERAVLIHKKDTRILSMLKNRNIKLSRTSIGDIAELVEYSKNKGYDRFESISTIMDKKEKSGQASISDELSSAKVVKISKGQVECNDKVFKLRSDLKIGADEFKKLEFLND